ncbi:MAG: hypothetical protein M1813_008378 [Trichoglossum hirsutum]|nr:MAG: hypothetical protein M1813_008378 [Trichoglossum hirsutum]
MSLTFIRIFASLALASLAAAADGATQLSCYGFKNGDGYNVDIVYYNTQQVSMSSICGSFNREFHKSCDPAPVNCETGDRNSMTLGVKVHKSSSDSFDCVTKAFQTALEATVGVERDGQCVDVVLPATPSRKRRSPSRVRAALSPRNTLTPGTVPTPGDFINLASGQVLRLAGLAAAGGDITVRLSDILPSLPAIGTSLGNTGNAIHSSFTALAGATGDMFASFDAGQNGGPGAVNAEDWSRIVGSLSTFLATTSRQRNAKAVFLNTANAVVMSVVISIRL